MPQTYSEQDDIDHVRWLSRAFLDRRYLRVDSKALFLVYRGRNLPSSGRTIETWRKEARKLGAGELLICAVESNFLEERIGNPTHLGFDAAVEFQPDIFAGGDEQFFVGVDARAAHSNVIGCFSVRCRERC